MIGSGTEEENQQIAVLVKDYRNRRATTIKYSGEAAAQFHQIADWLEELLEFRSLVQVALAAVKEDPR